MDFTPNKKLGFGLMRMPTIDPSNDADVDVEQVKAMVDQFIARGFTYFDTAWMYNGFASESVAKQALVDLQRGYARGSGGKGLDDQLYELHNPCREIRQSKRLYPVRTMRKRMSAAPDDHQLPEGRCKALRGLGGGTEQRPWPTARHTPPISGRF